MPFIFQRLMILWMRHREDMEQKLIHSLILITIVNMIQVRLLSEPHTFLQRDIQVRSTEAEFQDKNSVERVPLNSMSMFRIKLILMGRDKLLKIIAQGMSWIVHYGIAQVGPLRRTSTLIKIEPNIENNSINQNHSIREKSEKQLVDLLKNCWLMNQEIWLLLALVETILT